ncbi:hypothetical protein UJ101_01378 [Flavobacteriaceae bacterium UJ101]|nr:hypothetical protein UJ101_01378 [Flavobacteriaceae bacterium UJ101]
MKTILVTLCAVISASVFTQEIKNHKLKTKASTFEINVLSSDVLIKGYNGDEIIVKETIEVSDDVGNHKVFFIETDDHNISEDFDISFDSKSKESSKTKEKEERRKGLKPIKKEMNSDSQTTLKEKDDKVILTNFSSNGGDLHRIMLTDFNKSKFEIKVPNKMKIVVKKGKGISPFMLGKDTQFKIENFKGEIEIASLNQDVVLENVSNSALVNTMLGDIEATFNDLDQDAVISLISTAGFVDISVPSKENITFDLESMTGEILTNLDLKAKGEKNTSAFRQKYKANYNGGGKVIHLKSTAGDIYIRKE